VRYGPGNGISGLERGLGGGEGLVMVLRGVRRGGVLRVVWGRFLGRGGCSGLVRNKVRGKGGGGGGGGTCLPMRAMQDIRGRCDIATRFGDEKQWRI
jgi:hypothetical protein